MPRRRRDGSSSSSSNSSSGGGQCDYLVVFFSCPGRAQRSNCSLRYRCQGKSSPQSKESDEDPGWVRTGRQAGRQAGTLSAFPVDEACDGGGGGGSVPPLRPFSCPTGAAACW